MILKPIKWNEVENYPIEFTPDQPYSNILPISIQKDEVEYGIVVLKTLSERVVEAQLFIKDEFRGKTLTKSFWKQIYSLVFNVLGFKEFVAITENPLMANILKRENWTEVDSNHWFITKDKVRWYNE